MDVDTAVFALEKDEEAFTNVKECIKEYVPRIRAPSDKFNEALEEYGIKNPYHFKIEEDQLEDTVSQGMDLIKLAQLFEADKNIYNQFKEEFNEKYPVPEEE